MKIILFAMGGLWSVGWPPAIALDPAEGVVAIARKVADWQLANPNTTPEHGPTEWTQGALYTGIMAAYGITGDQKYLNAMLEMGRGNEWRLGPRTYFADDHAVGQTYCELSAIKNDPEMIAPMREQFDAIMAAPRTRNLEWPPKGAPKDEWQAWSERWSWCDALFMAPPAWAKLYKVTGDPRYLEFMDREWWTTTEYLYDKEEHLFYRDSRFFTQKTPGGKKMFWARGNGWVIAGLARVLECLPDSFPSRPRYEKLFREMAASVAKRQQPDGLWRPSLADPEHIVFGETSGSAFFCYALAWGINHGLLDAYTYRPIVEKAWSALCAKVDASGRLGGVQRIGGAPDKVSDADTDVYGVGAFLLAGKEVLIMDRSRASDVLPISAEQIRRLREVAVQDWLQSPDLNQSAKSEVRTKGKSIEEILAGMSADGAWPDVDYESKLRQSWPALKHFEYLHALALAYHTTSSPWHQNPEVKSKILRGIDYWLSKGYTNPNWWYNCIGVPAYALGPLLLMFQDDLTPAQLARGVEILARCDLKSHHNWRSGGNLIFDCRAALHYGLLAGDAELLGRLYGRMIYGECRQTPPKGSGVKEDWSEWEHGNLLFNHGYGALLAAEAARLLSYAHNAGIPVRNEAPEFISNYLLNGSQWMARGTFLDYSAKGRAITRPEQPDAQRNYLAIAARYLAPFYSSDAKRQGELEGLVRRVSGEDPAIEGNRLFYVSDFMSHSRHRFYASVRMFSSRTLNTEICNGENRLGHHLGEGATWIVADGDEYRDVFPAWDWLKVPGTTVNKSSLDDALVDEVTDSGWFPSTNPEDEGFGRARLRVSRRGRTDFVGGVSDGKIGVACFDTKVLGLCARKSWFFLDDGVVCLGAGITDTESGGVITTLNQCRKSGPVTILDREGQKKTLSSGCMALPGVRLVHHGRFTYLFPWKSVGSKEVVCSVQTARGNRHRLDVNQSEAQVERDIFSLWIEHGEKPVEASYAYRIVADSDGDGGLDLKKAKAALEGDEVRVLSNTKWLQAIHDRRKDVVAAAFYHPGRLVDGQLDMRVSAPCALLYEPAEGKLFVSDPTGAKQTINIDINGKMYFVRVDSGRPSVALLGN